MNWLAFWFLHRKVCQLSHYHLSPHERYQIEQLRSQHLSVACIALRLGRHRSTIYRELLRCPRPAYRAEQAQQHRQQQSRHSAANAPQYPASTWAQVHTRLAQDFWSPRQIAGRARIEPGGPAMPCAQAIYNWARRCWPQRAQRPLRRAQRKGRGNGPAQVFGWAKAVQPIAQRPAHVRTRQELGHWEADTMVGTRGGFKARLLVCVERASRYSRLALVDNAMPEVTAAALHASLLAGQDWPVHTLTTDRGSEFARLASAMPAQRLYVCEPRRPNQRGTNENTIGLIRQFIPKGQPLSLHSAKAIQRIEDLLNNRPRACLGFRTPAEVLLTARSQCRDSN